MITINKDAKHCQKRGDGDYDVCWEPIDLCSCKCQMCLDADALFDYENIKYSIELVKQEYAFRKDMFYFVINECLENKDK